LIRLASERPYDPLLFEDPGPTNDEEREWAGRFALGPNEVIPGGVKGPSADLEAFFDRLGKGADMGPGELERPRILRSSG